MSKKVNIEFIEVSKLPEIAKNAILDKKRFPFIPITKKRAFAQAKNPIIESNDIGLILAFIDNVCVGYLGLLPCILRKEQKKYKVYAFTAFFVDEPFRKYKIAHKIIENAISLNYDYFFSGYTDAFYKFSIKNPQWFRKIGDTHFIQINLDLLIPLFTHIEQLKKNKKSLWSKKPLLHFGKALVFFIRHFSHIKWFRKYYYDFHKSLSEYIDFRSVKKVSHISTSVQKKMQYQYFFYRDINTVNWMIQNPWISEDPKDINNYFFSDWREKFQYYAYELHDKNNGEYLGYLVFSLSKRGDITTLTILDNEFINTGYKISGLIYVLNIAVNKKVDKIIAPDYYAEEINSIHKVKQISIHKSKGNFLVPAENSVFPKNQNDLKLQYCEGDIPFS